MTSLPIIFLKLCWINYHFWENFKKEKQYIYIYILIDYYCKFGSIFRQRCCSHNCQSTLLCWVFTIYCTFFSRFQKGQIWLHLCRWSPDGKVAIGVIILSLAIDTATHDIFLFNNYGKIKLWVKESRMRDCHYNKLYLTCSTDDASNTFCHTFKTICCY